MMATKRSRDWMPAIMCSALVAGLGYLFAYAPERDRRVAVEDHILSAARQMKEQDCRVEMLAEGIDEARFENAGGYVRYEKLDPGPTMLLFASFVDDRQRWVTCEISLAPKSRVSVFEPDDIGPDD